MRVKTYSLFIVLIIASLILSSAIYAEEAKSDATVNQKKTQETPKAAEKNAIDAKKSVTAAPPARKKSGDVNKKSKIEIKTTEKKAEIKVTKQKDPKEKAADEEKQKAKQEERNKKKIEWIEKTLQYGVNKDRREAINAMLGMKSPEYRQRIENNLLNVLRTETDPELMVKAITVAGELKISAAAPEFKKKLDDDSEDVRIAAVNGLKHLNDTSANENIMNKLKAQDLSKDSNLTEAMITTLGDLKCGELRTFAETAIKEGKTTKNIRDLLVLSFGKVGTIESKDFLLKLARDEEEDKDVRAYAINSLSHIGIKESGKDINEIIKQIDSYPFKKKKEYYNLYMYCIAALAKLGDEGAFPRLMDSLKSDSAAVRLKAIKLIRESKDKRTIDILKYKSEYDPSPAVQKAAKEALEELGVAVKKDDGAAANESAEKSEDTDIPGAGAKNKPAARKSK